MKNIEHETVKIEEIALNKEKIFDFATEIYQQFLVEFNLSYVGSYHDLISRFRSNLSRLITDDTPTTVEEKLPNGLSFGFVCLKDQVYRNEREALVDLDGQEIQTPLEDEYGFRVEVCRFKGDHKSFEKVCDFFWRLIEAGASLENLDPRIAPKGEGYYGDVAVQFNTLPFEIGVEKVRRRVFTPREFALDRMGSR